MHKIICVAVLAAMATFGTTGAGHAMDGVTGGGTAGTGGVGGVEGKEQVSRAQYRILLNQCRYAATKAARRECRAEVRRTYTIGATNPDLDCRTYSSVTVCGKLTLSPGQKRCVRESVRGGLTYRRAEVECYAFYKSYKRFKGYSFKGHGGRD
ncbi:hypothetical protein [Microtetraspora niveoalba]|uniref:hypothetical protein n=1 Tax=Microtetraspora niveoalba TaxID=46175 RepID=UPI0008358497|nr:hypothetical protein [Microtetraspora niveoalba]